MMSLARLYSLVAAHLPVPSTFAKACPAQPTFVQVHDFIRAWSPLRCIGDWVLGLIVWAIIPFTSNLRPKFTSLTTGAASGYFVSRRALRSPIGTVHPGALFNFGEFIGSLSIVTLIEAHKTNGATGAPLYEGMPTAGSAKYHKPAFGKISGSSRVSLTEFEKAVAGIWAAPAGPGAERAPGPKATADITVKTDLMDAKGECVATVSVTWTLRPWHKPAKPQGAKLFSFQRLGASRQAKTE